MNLQFRTLLFCYANSSLTICCYMDDSRAICLTCFASQMIRVSIRSSGVYDFMN